MARRFGSAMISNTESTLLIYSLEHIPVKAYKEPEPVPWRARSEGGSGELEQMDSADSPLGVNRIHRDGHRQFRCVGTRDWNAAAVDHLLAAAAACRAFVHRSLFIHAAVCHEVAQHASWVRLPAMTFDATSYANAFPYSASRRVHAFSACGSL